MKIFLLLPLFFLISCSSTKITDINTSVYQQEKDLSTELSMLPGIIVNGEGRLASINFNCGAKASFVLNGQVEQNYQSLYDMVKVKKLKSVRILNLSEALIYGVRGETANIIIVETE